MEDIINVLKDRCRDLITKINILQQERYVSLPLARYILSIPYMLPVKHIFLAERPYATDIFPYAASAMSYDAYRNIDTTPIVHFLALDISNGSDLSYETCRQWFRDSWKYLNSGVLLLNVCTTYGFMDNRSEKERVAMEEFIRDMIWISLKLCDTKIHIYALGNPAQHSAGRIRSSITANKIRVVIHGCKNPAVFKLKLGDTMSPNFTIGAKSITKLFTGIIKATLDLNNPLSEEDCFKMASGGSNDLGKVQKHLTGDVFQEVSDYFKSNTGPMIERNDELFSRLAQEVRELNIAFSSVRIQALFAKINEPQGTSKPAYFNKRTTYNAGNYSKGSSSRASVKTPGKKQSIGFADDDDTPEEPVTQSTNTGSESNASTPRTTGFTQSAPTPQTPSPMPKYASSNAGLSSATRRTTHIGFIDESDSEEPESKDFNVNLTVDELQDLSMVLDFIDPASENYTIEPAVIEFIQETIRTKKAANECSREIVTIIRETRSDSKLRSVANALGMDDMSIQDVSSPVMQWILKYVSN